MFRPHLILPLLFAFAAGALAQDAQPAAPKTTRVIYVVDGTGSMMGRRQIAVTTQLERSINTLKPTQGFILLVFRDGKIETPNEEGTYFTGDEAKRAGIDWLHTRFRVGGDHDPLPAIRRAFELKPQLIYYITDDDARKVDPAPLVAEIAKLNADKAVRVNTVLIDTKSEKSEAALKQIAADNNGRFAFWTAEDATR
jgi:hypothetical protein